MHLKVFHCADCPESASKIDHLQALQVVDVEFSPSTVPQALKRYESLQCSAGDKSERSLRKLHKTRTMALAS